MNPTLVLLTWDVEFYPLQWRGEGRPQTDIERDIWGITREGAFGLGYQLERMKAYGLKGVFFVESLAASCPGVGDGYLSEVVRAVRSGGHEVQLHLHPEWIPHIPELAARCPPQNEYIKEFEEAEQEMLLKTALENLSRCGAPDASAFRAGDYAADNRTLRALGRAGLRFDSSHNTSYPLSGIALPEIPRGPGNVDGIWEVPVTCFEDYPSHQRHAQLIACSAGELTTVLLEAQRGGWPAVVVVLHSFELIRNRRTKKPVLPRRTVIRRFEKMLRFLSENRDTLPTGGFAELEGILAGHRGNAALPVLRGGIGNWALRNCEQLWGRMFG